MSNRLHRVLLKGALVGLASLMSLSVLAAPNTQYYQREAFEEAKEWKEAVVTFPEAPIDGNLIEIYLNATSQNRFWVDRKSVSVGDDGVVRYSLVVLSAGGVRGVTYEGIRCETRELRRYATLRPDNEWAKSRNENWSRITESPGHRQHAVLFLQHLCPDAIPAKDAQEAVSNLLRGGRFPGDSSTMR